MANSVLGRPTAVLLASEIAGLWRPRKSSRSFQVNVKLWVKASATARKATTEQAEPLAAYRPVLLYGIDFDR